MAATAPQVSTVPGTTLSPTAPLVGQPGGDKYNAWGALKKTWRVAGFTSDAASMNVDYLPASGVSGDVTTQYYPAVDTNNYIGYDTDRWKIYGEDNVTTPEVKAELVTSDDTNPTGTYTGTGDQVGDSPTVLLIPPIASSV